MCVFTTHSVHVVLDVHIKAIDNGFVTHCILMVYIIMNVALSSGPKGPSGATGAHGATGPIGFTGQTGLPGPRGVQGETGSTGNLTLLPGLKGYPGPRGAQGIPGASGTVCFCISAITLSAHYDTPCGHSCSRQLKLFIYNHKLCVLVILLICA